MTAQFDQMVLFLRGLDAQLRFKKKVPLYLIGGSAITLAYDPQNRTADLDFIDPPEEVIATGGPTSPLARRYHVYVSPVSEINFSVPKDWREHCHPSKMRLKRFRLMIPAVEDIVLGKLARMEPKDFEDILSLYHKNLVSVPKLLARLRENKKELRTMAYRQNARLLFKEVFHLTLVFAKGDFKTIKDE